MLFIMIIIIIMIIIMIISGFISPFVLRSFESALNPPRRSLTAGKGTPPLNASGPILACQDGDPGSVRICSAFRRGRTGVMWKLARAEAHVPVRLFAPPLGVGALVASLVLVELPLGPAREGRLAARQV